MSMTLQYGNIFFFIFFIIVIRIILFCYFSFHVFTNCLLSVVEMAEIQWMTLVGVIQYYIFCIFKP